MLAAAILALLAAASASDSSDESSPMEERSEYIRNLRRQLMRDNSDYSYERPKTTESSRPIDKQADPYVDIVQHKLTTNYYVTQISNDRMVESVNETKPEHSVSEKDLWYYVDDNKILSSSTTSQDKTYKTLKVRQFRRSGGNQYIQEEGPDGVAVVSLRRAPFPDLGLPSAHRQYRSGNGRADTADLDLPPPPV